MVGKKEQKISDLIDFVTIHDRLPAKGDVFGNTNVFALSLSIQGGKTYHCFLDRLKQHPLLEKIVEKGLLGKKKSGLSVKKLSRTLGYDDEIFKTNQQKEMTEYIPCDFLKGQDEITAPMRSVLIDWLIDVHLKFRFVPQTLFLTVHYIDRFLEKNRIAKNQFQCVGITAFFIASKFEELAYPVIDEILYMTDYTYTKEDILRTEKQMLFSCDFKLTISTPYCFLPHLIKISNANDKVRCTALYILERSLQEQDCRKYLPSMLCATSLSIAREINGQSPWTLPLKKCSIYSIQDLDTCKKEMLSWVRTKHVELHAVYRKYKSNRYGNVSNLNF